MDDPCMLDPGFPACSQTQRPVDAPAVDVFFARLGVAGVLFLLGVLMVIVLVAVYWKMDSERTHRFS